MRTIKWGIIGCGNVCENKSGPAFYKCNNAALVAVMRRDAVKAADFARRHNVPRWYNNVDDLINDPDVDVVYVATPPSTHAQYAIKVLQAGKPVYVEKPMAMNYTECLAMLEAAQQSKQKLWVAYYRRALPYFIKIKQLLDENAIGDLQAVTVRYFRPPLPTDLTPETQTWHVNKAIAGGGYFYDMATHTLDILHYLFGDFVEVNGIVSNKSKLYNVEDTVCASFRFKSGLLATGTWLYASNSIEKEDSIEIIGTQGTLCFSTFGFASIKLHTSAGVQLFNLPPPQHIQQPLIQCIVNEMLGNETVSPSTGDTAAHTNWVVDRIFEVLP